ncbi:MAG: hypothetical protein FGM46_01825 [Ferruginibacter sp.]|nr:hypothetical protein [Ferruginibacter sp.]
MISAKNIIKKSFKVLLYLLIVLVVLMVAFWIYINTPAGKRMVRNQVQSYLEKQLHTKVKISSIDYSIPNWIKLKGVFIEDLRKDTLFYGGEVYVKLNMLKLLNSEVDVKKINLNDIYANISRPRSDTSFNFQFIIDAFSGKEDKKNNEPSRATKLDLKSVSLSNIRLRLDDQYDGTSMYAQLESLHVSTESLNTDKMLFNIDRISGKGIKYRMSSFAPAKSKPTEDSTTSTPLMLTIKKLDLENIDVQISDSVSGFFTSNKLAQFNSTQLFVDTKNKKLSAGDVVLNQADVALLQNKNKIKPKPTIKKQDEKSWDIRVQQILLSKSKIVYDDNNHKSKKGFDANHVAAQQINASLTNINLTADSTAALVRQFSFKEKCGFAVDSTYADFLMKRNGIALNSFYIKTPNSTLQRSVNLSYTQPDDFFKKPKNTQITAVLGRSIISFKDLYLIYPELNQMLPESSFRKDQIVLNSQIRGNLARLYIPQFQFSGFSGSRIDASATLLNMSDTKKIGYDIQIKEAQFLKKDIVRFTPKEHLASLNNLPDVIDIKGGITGNTNNLTASLGIKAKGIDYAGKIVLNNLSQPDKLTYALNTEKISADKSFFVSYIPKNILNQYYIPDHISFAGNIGGNMNDLQTDFSLRTSLGTLGMKGTMKNFSQPDKSNYDLHLSFVGFNLGKLIKQEPTIRKVTGKLSAKGRGFDYKTMQADIRTNISSIGLMKYDYNNIDVDAFINKGLISSSGNIKDKNIKLYYSANADISKAYPTIDTYLDIDTVQFKNLGFSDDKLNLSGRLSVAASSLTPRNLNASVKLDKFIVTTPELTYPLYNSSVTATSFKGIDSIFIKAPFAELKAGGAFDYDKLLGSLEQHLSAFFKIPGWEAPKEKFRDQEFGFKGHVMYDSIFKSFSNELKGFETIELSGKYRSDVDSPSLKFTTSSGRIQYGNFDIKNFNVDLVTRNDKLVAQIFVDTFKNGDVEFYQTGFTTEASEDQVRFHALTKDELLKDWFGLSASVDYNGEDYTFRLTDHMKLNYEDWTTNENNYIKYTPKGIYIHDFSIRNDSSRIDLNSEEQEPNSPIHIDIDNFNLKNISTFLRADSNFSSGTVDARLRVSELDMPVPAIEGTADIANLHVMGYHIGDIKGNAEMLNDEKISANILLLGNENDIKANIEYYPEHADKELDGSISIGKLDMKTLQAFSFGHIRNSSGKITGGLNIHGRLNNLIWDGALNFDTTRFTVTMLGTSYKITNQKIVFNKPAVLFNNFIVQDTMNHSLKLNGKIALREDSEFDIDISGRAKEFILFNARKSREMPLLGYLAADANMTFSGSTLAPYIDGDVFVNDKTDLTIVLPDGGYVKEDFNTLVRFVDRDTFFFADHLSGLIDEQKVAKEFSSILKYNVNLDVNKNTRLRIIIDPATGDEMMVQGDAHLNAGVDPGGNLYMSGIYELDKGYYVLNYEILKKQFNLVKGSTITFGGAPGNALINISAEYIANTSAEELLANEIKEMSPEFANAIKQKFPFPVILNITGKMTKPNISFDLRSPKESNLMSSDLKSAIDNKFMQLRQDPAATNKQVFSLLLLNKFLGEQSADFFKSYTSDFSNIAKRSVSRFVSSALNELAGDLFKGIDVDLNLNSYNDFTKGGKEQKMDLNVAVSKSFFSNRLTVSVGSNFGLTGNTASRHNNSVFRPDVSLSYKLSKDGKYLVRAYTKNQFEVVLDGYVIENGLAFMITMDYNKFNELFNRKKRIEQ